MDHVEKPSITRICVVCKREIISCGNYKRIDSEIEKKLIRLGLRCEIEKRVAVKRKRTGHQHAAPGPGLAERTAIISPIAPSPPSRSNSCSYTCRSCLNKINSSCRLKDLAHSMESTMEGPLQVQNNGPLEIYLYDVLTSDMWMQQRNIFFEQRQHHHSVNLGNVSKRDEEFVFHLLEVHAKFCLKTNSCQPVGGNANIQKSNLTGLKGSSSVMMAAPFTSTTSNFVRENPSITGMTVGPSSNFTGLQVSPSVMMAAPSSSTTSDFVCENPSITSMTVGPSSNLTGLQVSSGVMMAAPTTSTTSDFVRENPSITGMTVDPLYSDQDKGSAIPNNSEETTGGWIPEQPHANWVSPDRSHDLPAVGLSRPIKLEKQDDVPEDAAFDARGAASHSWMPDQPVVNHDLPGTSHDQHMDVITAVVKIEEEDED